MAVGLYPHGNGGGSDDEQCVVCVCIVTHACTDDSNEDESFLTLKLIITISTPLLSLLLDRPTMIAITIAFVATLAAITDIGIASIVVCIAMAAFISELLIFMLLLVQELQLLILV